MTNDIAATHGWLLLSFFSALFLGMYDIAKKKAVTGNAVLPVLFFSTCSGVLCILPCILLSLINSTLAQHYHLFIPSQSLSIHLLIIMKSIIVGTSWILSYVGLKHLPITIASPLRATAPLFTVLGAVFFMGERPTYTHWSGIGLILVSYLLFSKTSRTSASEKAPLIWIIFMILSAVTGAASAGYDKYLLQARGLPPLFVLSWFLIYLSILYGIVILLSSLPQRIQPESFSCRPSILCVGVFLVIADMAYMTALSNPLVKLSLVSSIRRSNVIISFVGGYLLFHEGNLRRKLLPFIGIIAGLVLIMM